MSEDLRPDQKCPTHGWVYKDRCFLCFVGGRIGPDGFIHKATNDPADDPTPPPSAVDEAERLLEGITPGDFDVFDETDAAPDQRGNVAFIASAPRLVRALVAEVRGLDTLVDRVQETTTTAQRNTGEALVQRDAAIARAEKAEAAYRSTLAALDRVHEREAALNEALWRANLEVARLREAIEAHREATGESRRRFWFHDRALWAALDNPAPDPQ